MNLLQSIQNQTMSSIDLLKLINKARQSENEPTVRLNKLALRII